MAKKKRAEIVWFAVAAQRFNVTPETLKEWVDAGAFPRPHGEGNQLFYTAAELDAIVEHGFLGRWKPRGESPGKSGKRPESPAKGRKDRDSAESEGED